MSARVVLAALLALAAASAQAGDCRARLRPLLTNLTPAADDLVAVRALCRAEADAGDADSLYQLALFHLCLCGEQQPRLATPLISEAAAAGVPEAQYWLGWQHESGDLLASDTALALGWYQRAASADHRLALARLAEAYAEGQLGLAADPLRAAELRARQARCLRPALSVPGG